MSLTHVILTKHFVGPITLHYRSGHVIVIALSQQCDWPILANQYMQNHAAKTFSGCIELESEATIVIFFSTGTWDVLTCFFRSCWWLYSVWAKLDFCYNFVIIFIYICTYDIIFHCNTVVLSLINVSDFTIWACFNYKVLHMKFCISHHPIFFTYLQCAKTCWFCKPNFQWRNCFPLYVSLELP